MSLLEPVERLRQITGSGARYLFVAQSPVYLCLLLALHRRRQAHEIEVLHDDLYAEIEGPAARLAGGYDPQAFRAQLVQLQEWGNVTERVEPTRIRSLADRGRSKLLLRLEPETAAFLSFLESRLDDAAVGVREEGLNLLADIDAGLREALSCLLAARRAKEGEERDATLARAAHLVREADARAERIAEELVRVSDALASFVAEPFRLARIAEVGGFLEAYLERYLAVLDARGQAIRRALKVLAGPKNREAWARAGELERERVRALGAAVVVVDPPAVVARLAAFFSGRLEALCAQVNRRTREVIRRLQRHVETLRLRNVRTETIRARAAELFREPGADAQALAWLERLVASARLVTDAREGSPEHKAQPPRPQRRYETRRPAFRGEPLAPKQGSPQETRALELRRLQVLSEFVEQRVLRGRAAALLSSARLADLGDARRVVAAFSAHTLRGGKHRAHLGYRLERAEGRAVLAAGEAVLDAPELHVRRRS